MGMGGGGKPNSVKSEINVTPLVDVVLVLLIIFLVTMPVVMRTVTLEVQGSRVRASSASGLRPSRCSTSQWRTITGTSTASWWMVKS